MKAETILKIQSTIKCRECDRVFNLLDDQEAQEWNYGHDCEAI